MTKSDFIRAHPTKSAAEIVAEATKAGLNITSAMVYTIRGRPIPTRGRGRPPKNGAAAPLATARSSATREAAPASARLVPAKERLALLALEVGLDRAEHVLAQLRRALG